MTALIIGANGQDGYYLSELLGKKGIKVFGVARNGNFLRTDISHPGEVINLISEIHPDYIFHLAANSTTSHDALFENHQTISTGTLNILEAVRKGHPAAKVFLPGSGLQFINHGKPINENDSFFPGSPYAVSRIQSVMAARYFRSLGIKAYVGYFFNHESPLRSERHISQRIATVVKRIADGSNEQLEIGDAKVKKEWGFAGDIVHGIWTLVQQEEIFEATIGTGTAYAIQDWIEACFNLIGKNWKPYVVYKKDYTAEYKILVSDPKTIFSLGWRPDISFEQLAKMMVNPNE